MSTASADAQQTFNPGNLFPGYRDQQAQQAQTENIRAHTEALRAWNECMRAWVALLPGTVRHKTITVDLEEILRCYQERYGGAMYSGCGGGYLFVATDRDVPGSFVIRVRTS